MRNRKKRRFKEGKCKLGRKTVNRLKLRHRIVKLSSGSHAVYAVI